ncbi:MAG TPA: hypothetical protein PLG77_04540 [Burkholderiaceae bacterium]|nr:hypothetical protein [Burkholderiaceae bacterium]
MPDPTSSTAPVADDANAALAKLNRLFVQALVQIGKCGDANDIDAACRLAAQGWSALRRDWPREAERLNGVMHSLTGPRHTRQPGKGAEMTATETASATETSTERMQSHER